MHVWHDGLFFPFLSCAVLCPPMRLSLAPPLGYENPRALVGPREISPGGTASDKWPARSGLELECFCSGIPGPASRLGSACALSEQLHSPARCPVQWQPSSVCKLDVPSIGAPLCLYVSSLKCPDIRGWRRGG